MLKLTDHNHVCDEARIVKWLILAEMLKDVHHKASAVRKRVIVAFKQKYKVVFSHTKLIWAHTNAMYSKTCKYTALREMYYRRIFLTPKQTLSRDLDLH